MEIELLGWPPDGPTLQLDHRRFGYAGKFVMSNTGKAVVREDRGGDGNEDDDEEEDGSEGVIAAVAFNEDRTDPDALWLRYVTVREDRRGEGIGPRLLGFVRDRALERGYERVRIAVNNPFAYEACYRAGFSYTGRRTGIAELVLEHPGDRSAERYREGLEEFRERDLSAAEEAFLDRRGSDPPESER